MKRVVHILTLATLLAAAASTGCGDARSAERQQALATVGEVEITPEDFRARYVDYLLRTGTQDASSLRRTMLDEMVVEALLVQDSRARGIAQNGEYRGQEARTRQKLLIEGYIDQAVYGAIEVTDAELHELFERVNTQVKARHLYARTEAEARRLYQRLAAGEAFEALAREVFADPRLAESGGSLGYFGFDEMDPAFEDAAFTLPVGEVSEPVRTAQGYSVIQVEDRFTNPVLTETEFAQKRGALEAFVQRRKRFAARTRFAQETEASLGVTFEEPMVEALLGQITGTSVVTDEEAFARLLAQPLLHYREGGRTHTWTLDDFRERAGSTDPRQRAQVRTADDLRAFAGGLVVRDVLVARAVAAGIDEAPEYRAALRGAMDDWIVRAARDEVEAGVTVPDAAMQAHYEAHADEYVMPEQVRLHEIMTETRAEAEALKAQLGTASFGVLARRHTIRPGANALDGDLGFVSARQLGEIADPVFDASEGDVLGPLSFQGRYILLQVGERLPARPMTFEEARGAIHQELFGGTVAEALADHVAALRAQYEVHVDAERLASLSLLPSR